MRIKFIEKLLFLQIILFVVATDAEREHKVHNIILYPEKHSWCQTTPIQQVVASPGYEAITIDNNVCVGACYSYSIPSTQPAEPGELIGPYCDSCQPVETKCYHVTLNSDGKNIEGPRTTQKRVQIIMNCTCMSCEKIHKEDCELNQQNTIELPLDLFSKKINQQKNNNGGGTSQLDDIPPELLHFKHDKNRIHIDINDVDLSSSSSSSSTPTSSLINLLKIMQKNKINKEPTMINQPSTSNNNDGEGGGVGDDDNDDYDDTTAITYDKGKLKELLKIIENSKNSLIDNNKLIMDFIKLENLNLNNLNIDDLNELKQLLIQLKKKQNLLDTKSINSNQYLQSSSSSSSSPLSSLSTPLNHHHHHHLGDELNVNGINGHLIKGPHGSMILAPPPPPSSPLSLLSSSSTDLNVEEKLNIDSDILKPNHDGLVISYENPNNHHPKSRNLIK